MTNRRCGDCTTCCKLMPIDEGRYTDERVIDTIKAMVHAGLAQPREFIGMRRDFKKPAGEKCPHQRVGKGCTIYPTRPFGCRYWNCRWLVDDDTHDQRRPDRSHVVIDMMPDFIQIAPDAGGEPQRIQVVQMWCDPSFPDAHRAPEIRAYMERRAAEGIATLVRFNGADAIAVFAPIFNEDGKWREMGGGTVVAQYETWPEGVRAV